MASQPSETEASSPNRVKVYQLNHDGAWEDQGTGYAGLINQDIVVHAEEDEKPSSTHLILEAPVIADDVYQQQGDTIISWHDPNTHLDLALSFQEADQCKQFWRQVAGCQSRGRRRPDKPPLATAEPGSMAVEQQRLPDPSLDTLGEIANIVNNCGLYHREYMAQAFTRKEYLRQLIEQFTMCEDLENADGLSALFRIFKGMVMLNDNCLLETLLSDEYIMSVIGVLEYDPELSSRTHHRQYLTQTVVFKEVVPIRDPAVLANIHQNFRVAYLKDVILAKYLDDHTFSTLSTLIYFNSVEIVNQLASDNTFLDGLFSGLLDQNTLDERLADLVGLLQEFCSMAKNLQVLQRAQFYRKLVEYNLFGVLELTLGHVKRKLRLSGVEIANGLISQESHLCRTQMMMQTPKCGLMGLLIDQLFSDNDAGMKGQLAELIRLLLDPELMEGTSEKDDFLNLFYEAFMEPLVACIPQQQLVLDKMSEFRRKDGSGQCGREQMDSDCALVVATQNQVCEILAFCVQSHGYRIKYFILRHNIVQKALQLVLKKGSRGHHRVTNNHLTLTVMRFVRACVGLKDEFYNRHLVKNNLFELIMQAFQENGTRYNLFNSAVIELVEFCRHENCKTLVSHLVEVHRDKFSHVQYVSTFQDLIRKHEQIKDSEQLAEEPAVQQQSSQPWRRLAESDDESYFNESDSEENAEPPPALQASDMEIGPAPPNGYQNRSAPPPRVTSAATGPVGGGMMTSLANVGTLRNMDDVRPGSPNYIATSCEKGPHTQDMDGHVTKRLKVDAS